jgi:osmoprotectant transport system permease protein
VSSGERKVIVGSKDFTESVILAELVAQILEQQGVNVERRFELGGSLAHEALVANQINIYPEYTGTALLSILHLPQMNDAREVHATVSREYAARYKVEVGGSLGFQNDFAILVRGETARRLGLKTISDAVSHARGWQAGFGQDFLSRADGYEGFVRAYNFEFARPPREMDLSLTYRALASGNLDLIAGNSTDGLIAALDLVQLEDDRKYFPPYEAVLLINERAFSSTDTDARATLKRLENSITVEDMRRMNYEVDGRHREIKDVVREWRQSKGFGA